MIRQAYRFELDPNRTQRVLLAKSVGAVRSRVSQSSSARASVIQPGFTRSNCPSGISACRRLGRSGLRRRARSAVSRGALSRQRLLVALIAGSARSPLSANGKLSCRSLPAAGPPPPALIVTGENQVGDRPGGSACQGNDSQPKPCALHQRCRVECAASSAHLQERVVRLNTSSRESVLPVIEDVLRLRRDQGHAQPRRSSVRL